jgi:hypothetical protein
MTPNQLKIAPEYDLKYLESHRPQPLSDNRIEQLIQDVLSGNLDKDITDRVYDNFKTEVSEWILSSQLNSLSGIDHFTRKDIIIGCTQFIDNIYMKGEVQFLEGDYRYHNRLGGEGKKYQQLKKHVPLIIAMPFPSTGDVHPDMSNILDHCLEHSISVHIDGAWFTCCRDIHFDLTHPAIESIGISLSKGLGLGWNRIGLRWTRNFDQDSVTIMNDFNMNNRALAMIGLYFVRNLPSDYLWNTHGNHYHKICEDFGLTKTKSIYLALRDGHAVGISPLLRYLENYA